MKQLVIGILAHVDSGKTTLSESMLFACGEIKKVGRVDHGDAFLDSYTLERDRGITIFSKQATLNIGEAAVTLLDTPGHVDFSSEMERTIQVLDYAVLVISGTDGVQSHTETLWRLLKRNHVPTFIFVNKMDLPGTDRAAVIKELKLRLSDGAVNFNGCQNSGEFLENIALCDERLMNEFISEGEIPAESIVKGIKERKIFPCYFGSALKNQGVEDFINGLNRYTAEQKVKDDFGAKVFKISRDDQGNRLTYMKITGGSLRVKSVISYGDGGENQLTEKVNQIRVYSGAKYRSADNVCQGMVCAVTGLTKTYAGQGLGEENNSDMPVLEPVLTYRVELPMELDPHIALSKLRILEEEDPQLHVVWDEQLGEIHLQLMGEIQLEILRSIVWERFNLDVRFDSGSILYKETIGQAVEGVGHFEPLRHYAEVHLLLEPTPAGSGLSFASSCSEDVLDKNWQRLVLTHLEEKNYRGVLTGSPITDMKITLITGRNHEKHTEGGDFRQATYRGVRQGLMSAESILLEPWYSFTLEVPAENLGRAMADMQKMNGTFDPPENDGVKGVLKGYAPVSSMADYNGEVIGYTRGKGRLVCALDGYRPCHNAREVIEKIGYNAEGDVENTGDSVFCSHGTGFVVKWNHVREYMHIDGIKPEKIMEDTAAAPQRQATAFRDSFIEDKELMAIYEKTYGPIRRDVRTAFRPVKKEQPKNRDIVLPKLTGPEYLLVDGYNIIFAWEDLSRLAAENLDSARNRLIHMLCNYRGFRPCQLILVFDAYKVKGNAGEVEKVHNISVVYTKEAETADMYIEKVTHEIGRKHKVRVATSDGLEQMIILGHGALRISARAFRDEIDQVEKEISVLING